MSARKSKNKAKVDADGNDHAIKSSKVHDKRKSTSFLVFGYPAIFIVAAILTFFYYNQTKTNVIPVNPSHANNKPANVPADDWKSDEVFMKETISSLQPMCDFPIITEKEYFADPSLYNDKPFVFRGLASSWTATSRWTRHEMMKLYGHRKVLTGSESSIVNSGGSAGVSLSLNSILHRIRNETSQQSSNLFTFDVSILKSIPELKRDFPVPKSFQSWDNFQSSSTGFSWHLLSLGPTRAGLPFHTHSSTWLAVIHGAKRWFVYPPGSFMPAAFEAQYNPLDSVYDWFQHDYPQLKNQSKPPFKAIVSQDDIHAIAGYRPLECLQQAGDVLYLPKGWSHMTMNIGETIGIGGQAAFPATDRYEHAMEVLAKNPNNFHTLKDASLGLGHFAIAEVDELKHDIKATASGLIQLRPDNIDRFITSSHDSWIVFYVYLKDHSRETEYIMMIMKEIAARCGENSEVGKRGMNVGMIEINKYPDVMNQHELSSYCDNRQHVDDPHGIFPCIRIYPGAPSYHICDDFLIEHHDMSQSNINMIPSIKRQGITYHGSIEADKIMMYLSSLLHTCQLASGSILTMPVKCQAWFQQAISYIERAMVIQPYNSEMNSFYPEVLGLAGENEAMVIALQGAEAKYDDYIANRLKTSTMMTSTLPTQSIASIYHRLGQTYLIKEFANLSLPTLHKALSYVPSYPPALTSLAIAYNMLGDKDKAEAILHQLETIEPGNIAVRDIRRMMSVREQQLKQKQQQQQQPNTKMKPQAASNSHQHDDMKRRKEDHPSYTTKKKRHTGVKIDLHDDVEQEL